ncbi:MAG TPA: hypothetical protein VMX13_18510 [Sedimentisphaerales bacterium]|nr:hypothetical protein [Sedimentisphaerales bacterium]
MSEIRGLRVYLQPAFLVCAGVLALAGVGMDRLHVEKVAFRPKKSFDLLDEKRLSPYIVVSKDKIENEEVVRELGTTDYIQWVLEDPQVGADSAVRKCSLFITYYELPDYVPHVPEECYMGVGYQVLASEGVTFQIKGTSGPLEGKRIEGRYVVFSGADSKDWLGDTQYPVLYLFNVNGVYAGNREDARWLLNRYIFSAHVYFCKVEWKFFNTSFGQRIYPNKREALGASEKLLGVVLPILEGEHWPQWPVVSEKQSIGTRRG